MGAAEKAIEPAIMGQHATAETTAKRHDMAGLVKRQDLLQTA